MWKPRVVLTILVSGNKNTNNILTIIQVVRFVGNMRLQEAGKLIRIVEARHVEGEARVISPISVKYKADPNKSLNPCTPAQLNN